MAAKKYKTHYEDFELDLAPLLAIIMKLVPVLIITSSFLQLTQIDTDLPQVIKEAIQNQENNKDNPVHINVNLSKENNIDIQIINRDKVESYSVPAVNKELDFIKYNEKLIAIKKTYPEVFKLVLSPDESIPYSEIIKIMDESRKAKDNVEFTFLDTKTGHQIKTDYMFPEIIFGNIFN